MKRNYRLYLGDILDNMRFAEEMIKEIDFTQFAKNRNVHYTVIRCIEIVGEAAKHIPPEIREKHCDIPWKRMAGMRDKIIHFYIGIDLEIVWMVVKEDFPSLRPLIQSIFDTAAD